MAKTYELTVNDGETERSFYIVPKRGKIELFGMEGFRLIPLEDGEIYRVGDSAFSISEMSSDRTARMMMMIRPKKL